MKTEGVKNYFSSAILFLLLVFISAENSSAQIVWNIVDELAIHKGVTNSNTRLQNFFSDPRSNNIDIYYTRLNLILNPDTLYISASVSASFTAKQNLDTLFFDLYDSLIVDSIIYHSAPIAVTEPQNFSLEIILPLPISAGEKDSVEIFYHGKPGADQFGGFVKGHHDNNTKPLLFNLSEPYFSRLWWPCKQSLTDKIDSIDVIIQNPSQYFAASNGLMISRDTLNGWANTHWKHVYPITPYLVGVSVCDYSIYEDTVYFDSGDSLIILNYVFPEYLDTAKKYSSALVPVIKFYAEKFGDYPFMKEKYGHAQWSFGGGMEHQTMSFVGSMNYSLITHELAHQWFGDKLTCDTWRNIFLNEGFATYCTGLCYENFFPEQFNNWKTGMLLTIKDAGTSAVWVWDTTWAGNIFNYHTSYAKGAYMLHMLRWKIGDDNFFNALKNYEADTNLAYNFVGLPDLIQHFETTSGENLSEFFNEWYYTAGYPTYHLQWNQSYDNIVSLYLEQETNYPQSITFFSMPVPVQFIGEGQDSIVRFENTMNGQKFSVALPFKVDSVSIDPDLHLISFDNTVSRNPGFGESSLSLFPNPSAETTNLFYSSDFIPKSISIANAMGQQLFSDEINTDSRTTVYQLHAATLPAGIYFITVCSEWEIKILKWVKIK